MDKTDGAAPSGMPTVTLRALGADDRAGWEALWRAYLAFYDTALPADVYDTTFARYTDPARADMFAFVAERDGALVGLVHAIIHPHGWMREDVVYLQDLFTAPQARGAGIARALIEAVYAAADARGLGATYWLTQAHNTPARALYDRVARLTPFIKYQRA